MNRPGVPGPEPSGGDDRRPPREGLCPGCRNVRVVRSPKGSTFYLCQLAGKDARFQRYPPQPVVVCSGHAR